jgi:hypothetical protein
MAQLSRNKIAILFGEKNRGHVNNYELKSYLRLDGICNFIILFTNFRAPDLNWKNFSGGLDI